MKDYETLIQSILIAKAGDPKLIAESIKKIKELLTRLKQEKGSAGLYNLLTFIPQYPKDGPINYALVDYLFGDDIARARVITKYDHTSRHFIPNVQQQLRHPQCAAPLFRAVVMGVPEVVQLLLENGADPSLPFRMEHGLNFGLMGALFGHGYEVWRQDILQPLLMEDNLTRKCEIIRLLLLAGFNQIEEYSSIILRSLSTFF